MFVPIIYPSAAEFWLKGDPGSSINYTFNNRRLTNLPKEYFERPDYPKRIRWYAEDIAAALRLDFPLTLACANPNDRRRSKKAIITAVQHQFPDNSFVYFDKGGNEIYMASPELTFLQAAGHLDFLSLVQLGFGLCALYERNAEAAFGQRDRLVFTSKSLILDYLSKSTYFHNGKLAKKAVKYILDDSNSPMETSLAIIFILPIEMGGYGLRFPEMNKTVTVGPAAGLMLGIRDPRPDFCWEMEKVIVEYNSNAAHDTPLQKAADANRCNAYQRSGYKAFQMTADNVSSLYALDNFVRILRHALGDKDQDLLLQEFRKQRKETFFRLFQQHWLK